MSYLYIYIYRLFFLSREMESRDVKNKSSGKRKLSSENTRSYFAWDLEMECVLVEVLRDHRNLGNKDDANWKAVAYKSNFVQAFWSSPHGRESF